MRLAMTRSWTRASRLLIALHSKLCREILEVARDVGEIVLGLEVARLLGAVFVGAADEGGLHAVFRGANQIAVMRRHHHHRAGIVIAEKMAGGLVHLAGGSVVLDQVRAQPRTPWQA